MLIVCTDHGFLLGEHDWWSKMKMPWWNELANTPFFVWDPRSPSCAGTRRDALAQPSIDLAPTLLRFFDVDPTERMTGYDLAPAIESDTPVRQTAIFGVHGGHVNITDGRYVYMRGPASPQNRPLYEYTLMPTHMRHPFLPAELQEDRITLARPFSFTKGCATMRIGDRAELQSNQTGWSEAAHNFGTLLYDLQSDPKQTQPIDDPHVEGMMANHLVEAMTACDAPQEQFERLGLDRRG
jgi:hypothetical protein